MSAMAARLALLLAVVCSCTAADAGQRNILAERHGSRDSTSNHATDNVNGNVNDNDNVNVNDGHGVVEGWEGNGPEMNEGDAAEVMSYFIAQHFTDTTDAARDAPPSLLHRIYRTSQRDMLSRTVIPDFLSGEECDAVAHTPRELGVGANIPSANSTSIGLLPPALATRLADRVRRFAADHKMQLALEGESDELHLIKALISARGPGDGGIPFHIDNALNSVPFLHPTTQELVHLHTPRWRAMLQQWTVAIFCSHPESYDGGELLFHHPQQKVKPPRGHAVFFQSGWRNPHEVLPVRRGERLQLVLDLHVEPFGGTETSAVDPTVFAAVKTDVMLSPGGRYAALSHCEASASVGKQDSSAARCGSELAAFLHSTSTYYNHSSASAAHAALLNEVHRH